MQTITLHDHKRRRILDLTGPENFDQVTGQQLAAIIRIRKKYRNEDLQAIAIAELLFNVPGDQATRLTVLQKLQLAAEIEFVFDIDNIESPVKMDRWLFDSIPGTSLRGPSDTLANITFQELMHADRCLDAYSKTGEDQHLDELVAVLMRPRSLLSYFIKGEDCRRRFNHAAIKRRTAGIARVVDEDTRHAIRFNYVACRSQMAGYFKNLFPPAGEVTEHTNKIAANESWLDVAINLARKEPGALGTLHDIEKNDVYLVLKVLDQVIKEHKEREQALTKR